MIVLTHILNIILLLSLNDSRALILPTQVRNCRQHAESALFLVPISSYRHQISFFKKESSFRGNITQDGVFEVDGQEFTLSVLQASDVPDTARFIVETFGADAIALSEDLGSLERAFLAPSVGLVNAYTGLVAYAEVFSGILSRTKDRNDDISPPRLSGNREDKLKQAERSSLILVLGRQKPETDWNIEVIASVELRLQPTDAKIPFSFPWLDQLERRIANLFSSDNVRKLQPYLSNLCVSSSYRRSKLGTSLVRCVEDIALTLWGYDRMYLHVDLENTAARKLYEDEGYKDAGRRWRHFWAGRAAEIGYFVKKL